MNKPAQQKTLEAFARIPVETAITKGVTLDRAVGEFVAQHTKITSEKIECIKCGREIKEFVTEMDETLSTAFHPQCFANIVMEYVKNNIQR